jgi:hypothetical protein
MTTAATATTTTVTAYPTGSNAARLALRVGDWVVACCAVREDCDLGRIREISPDGDTIEVTWACGVSTPTVIDENLEFFAAGTRGYGDAVERYHAHRATLAR